MADEFLQPEEKSSTLQKIGRGLRAFGAGFEGQGQQFLSGQRQEQRQLSEERKRAAADDLRSTRLLLDAGNLQGVRNLVQERVGMIQQLGGDPSDTAGILQLTDAAIAGDRDAFNALDAQINAGLQAAADQGFIKLPKPLSPEGRRGADVKAGFIDPDQKAPVKPLSPRGKLQADIAAGIITSEQAAPPQSAEGREFAALTSSLPPEEKERAIRIKLGLDPRDVGAAAKIFDIGGVPHIFDPVTREAVPVKVRGEEITAGTVAGSQTQIAEAITRGKGRVVLSNKVIDKGFAAIGGINTNIRNIDRALGALGRGASTGFVQKFFPSIKAASVELGQIQKELGLDIVSAVTFGALSKGELDLALATALPVGLSPPDLTDFLNRKKVAQEKLRDYYRDQISFLDGGGTVAQFTTQQGDTQSIEGDVDTGQRTATGGIIIRKPDGSLVVRE